MLCVLLMEVSVESSAQTKLKPSSVSSEKSREKTNTVRNRMEFAIQNEAITFNIHSVLFFFLFFVLSYSLSFSLSLYLYQSASHFSLSWSNALNIARGRTVFKAPHVVLDFKPVRRCATLIDLL